MGSKICYADGCKNVSVSKELCDKHYRRFKKHGDPNFIKKFVKSNCRADGCDRFSKVKGLCDKHYRTLRRKGDPNWKAPRLGSDCSVDGCCDRRVAKGFCRAHYEQNRVGVDFASAKIVRDLWDGTCKICGTATPSGPKKTWCLDHDHKTGKARGVLCTSCNIGLGMFDDNIEIMGMAIEYLLKDKDVFAMISQPQNEGGDNE